MKTAYICVPPVPDEYPINAIRQGLAAVGFAPPSNQRDADILVTWSPWVGSFRASMEHHYRELGRPVIVIENGWLSPLGGVPYYQIALDGWNGGGRFMADNGRRWASWRVLVAPWGQFRDHDYALVIGQRGHPTDPRTCTPNWHEHVKIDDEVLRRSRLEATTPLIVDLLNAREVHVWTSNVASHALTLGKPVVQHGPNLMVSDLASRPGEPLRFPNDRERVFSSLACAQWSAEEIATGAPFGRLLEMVG